MEVGGRGRLYTYRCSVTTRMTPAVRWTAMTAVPLIVRDKVTRLFCPSSDATDHNLFEKRRAETESNRGPSSYQPNALLTGQTGSLKYCGPLLSIYLSIYLSIQTDRQTDRDRETEL